MIYYFVPRVNTGMIQLHRSAILRLFGNFSVSEDLLKKSSQVVVTAREGVQEYIFRKKEYFANLKAILGKDSNKIDEISKAIHMEETFMVHIEECESYPDVFN